MKITLTNNKTNATYVCDSKHSDFQHSCRAIGSLLETGKSAKHSFFETDSPFDIPDALWTDFATYPSLAYYSFDKFVEEPMAPKTFANRHDSHRILCIHNNKTGQSVFIPSLANDVDRDFQLIHNWISLWGTATLAQRTTMPTDLIEEMTKTGIYNFTMSHVPDSEYDKPTTIHNVRSRCQTHNAGSKSKASASVNRFISTFSIV